MSFSRLFGLTAVLFILGNTQLRAHCEIPCGIYGDQTRFGLLKEDAKTIEKSVTMINELSKDPAKNANQLSRWVMNKENHANKIKETVAFYFLSQRIKQPKEKSKKATEAYHKKLVALHQITVAAMKTKQTTDLDWVKKLMDSINRFETLYFKGHSK